MRRRILLAAALALLVLGTAGTAAYFSAEARARNFITSGKVAVALREWADEGETQPYENVSGVMPGTAVTKIAVVENTGSAPVWVRVRLEKSVTGANGAKLDASAVGLALGQSGWTDGDDGYYYNDCPLAPGETTEPVLTGVQFSPEMGNAYQGARAQVDVRASAVQTANNGASAREAAGWPADEAKGE